MKYIRMAPARFKYWWDSGVGCLAGSNDRLGRYGREGKGNRNSDELVAMCIWI